MSHTDHATVAGSEESSGQGDVADVAASDLKATGHKVQIQVGALRGLRRPDVGPDAVSVRFVRERKFDGKVHSAHEGVVHVLAEIGGEDHHAFVLFHLLQQIIDLNISVAVVRIAHLAALAEKGIRLVEEEDGVASFGFGEDASQILLGFADILADDSGKINLVKVQAQLSCHDLRGHGLACSRRSGEKNVEPLAQRKLSVEAPLVIHHGAKRHGITDFLKLLQLV